PREGYGPPNAQETACTSPTAGAGSTCVPARCATVRRRTCRRPVNDETTSSFSFQGQSVCDIMKRSSPGAQTEHRGDAGPVRELLCSAAAPAFGCCDVVLKHKPGGPTCARKCQSTASG